MNKSNITLIGMAGVGKSFTAKRLSAGLGYELIEVDQLITEAANQRGLNKTALPDNEFIELEEQVILGLTGRHRCIIDTGGSVVYAPKAMAFLQKISVIFYLQDEPGNIKNRFKKRGQPHLIGLSGKTFERLLAERTKLYEKFADVTVDVDGQSPKRIVEAIVSKFELTQG